ncbi:S8 family peptidase [Deinococcus enclensis]|uniref:Subtilisin family serine protease n=1 Tax=Deinococcus enclensis TaxID=1049582 RepID=A0ABT9M8R8_9DEIO|nr:S8 family serine peptidase [Deinococcus enclensis]MDP9762980.1 subtilisin family serine protease [Deinococcus enclensis]
MRSATLPTLLTLTALLAACGGGGSGGTPPTPTPVPPAGSVCPQGVSSGPSAQAAPLPFQPDFTAGTVTADWTAPHVPGEVLILGPAAANLSAQSVSALAGVTVQEVVPGLKLAATPAGRDDAAFAASLHAAGLRVQPNYLYRAQALPNDPGVNAGLPISGTRVTQTYLNRIKAPAAWDFLTACGKTPQGVVTAVIDSGVDASHNDLTGRLLTPQTVTSGAATQDDARHGTGVTGIIGAATNNGVAVAGLTWGGTNMLSIRMLDAAGEGSTTQLVQALQRAMNAGAKVINLSLGFEGANPDTAVSSALTDAAKQAVVIAAAGNTPGVGLFFPASHPAVISVGAVGSTNGTLACYSAKPDASQTAVAGNFIVAPGGIDSRCGDKGGINDYTLTLMPGSGYGLMSGTSFAAPQVSGVAALVRAANSNLTADDTKKLILATVDRSAGLPLLDANAAVRAATR